jgi:hypothetical protein
MAAIDAVLQEFADRLHGRLVALRSFSRPPLPQSDARSAAVLVDELYGGRLQGTPYYVKRSATWLMATGFEVSDGHKADAGLFGQFLLAPVE